MKVRRVLALAMQSWLHDQLIPHVLVSSPSHNLQTTHAVHAAVNISYAGEVLAQQLDSIDYISMFIYPMMENASRESGAIDTDFCL